MGRPLDALHSRGLAAAAGIASAWTTGKLEMCTHVRISWKSVEFIFVLSHLWRRPLDFLDLLQRFFLSMPGVSESGAEGKDAGPDKSGRHLRFRTKGFVKAELGEPSAFHSEWYVPAPA